MPPVGVELFRVEILGEDELDLELTCLEEDFHLFPSLAQRLHCPQFVQMLVISAILDVSIFDMPPAIREKRKAQIASVYGSDQEKAVRTELCLSLQRLGDLVQKR